jgi:hypothetical protein
MTPTESMHEYAASGRLGVEHTLRLIDDHAIYWFSDGTSHVGKTAVEKAIRRNFDAIKDERIGLARSFGYRSPPRSPRAFTALTGPESFKALPVRVRVVVRRSWLAEATRGL